MAIDWNAALARLDLIVSTLATCHVSNTFHLDVRKAEEARVYLQGRAEGGEENCGAEAMIEFACAHNVSTDYILRGDIRPMIAEMASNLAA